MKKKTKERDEPALEPDELVDPLDDVQAEDDSPEAVIERLRNELADYDDKWKRALAEVQNTRRQSRLNEVEAAYQGSRRVLESIIPVLDHFDLALGQDAASMNTEQIMDGVRVIRDEFLKALSNQNVTLLQPEPGDEFDPMRHEAMMRQPSEDVEPGHIVQALQVGYAMGDRVIRAAKVIIAEEAPNADV